MMNRFHTSLSISTPGPTTGSGDLGNPRVDHGVDLWLGNIGVDRRGVWVRVDVEVVGDNDAAAGVAGWIPVAGICGLNSPTAELGGGGSVGGGAGGRGLHSSTFRLNLSALCGIGVHLGVVQGLCRRCQGVLRSIRGCSGCILCQKRLKVELRSGRV
jgi:hypothetical protein